MDQRRFDQLSRGIALAGNRRKFLGGTLGAALAAVFGVAVPDQVAAKKPKGCGNGKKKCGNKCIPKKDCCKDNDCKSGQQCKSGTCKCKGGTKACGNKCIANAGCCNNADCNNGQTCEDNVCGGCTSTETACAGVCIPTGSCCAATDCPSGSVCNGNSCTITVTKTNLKGWTYIDDLTDEELLPVFVIGPEDPPAGSGSGRIFTPSADEKRRLSGPIYNGVDLNKFIQMSYATYVPASSDGTAASLQLGVELDPAVPRTGRQGRLVYVPVGDLSNVVLDDVWQTWNVTGNSPGWFFSELPVGVTPNPCPQNDKCTFAEAIAAFPNIRIHPDAQDGQGRTLGFIGMQCGRDYANQTSFVDALSIDVQGQVFPAIYEFEP